MADLERAARIKRLREQRHLTQPAVADRVGVSLRGYQLWEQNGSIRWENAKRLAAVLDVDPDLLWSGPRDEPAGTPALLDVIDGDRDSPLRQLQDAQEEIRRTQQQILDRIEALSDNLAQMFATRADEAAAADGAETAPSGRRPPRSTGRRRRA